MSYILRMKLHVNRTNIRLNPDYRKVIARFFNTGETRSKKLISQVLEMPDSEASHLLQQVMDEFSGRYRTIESIFRKHFDLIKYLLSPDEQLTVSNDKKLLIGSYFTMEYSIEAAALFNPSVVEDPDQSGIANGQKRVIVSFRATGESHISSLVFKRGILDETGHIIFEPSGKYISEGIVSRSSRNSRSVFAQLSDKIGLPPHIRLDIIDKLNPTFTYAEMELVLKKVLQQIPSGPDRNKTRYDILSILNMGYELQFDPQSHLSERVIFPVTYNEKNGIEDARFVKFTGDDGVPVYMATYTAYDGSFILPQLIETKDFRHFKISPLQGKSAINKNLALFPRKINGQYAMISRIDGINNYIMFSDDLYLWETATLWQEPRYPWEFVQIGNGGSPIETSEGWLVITHGVGPMRKYCLGASLFDLHDPRKELGRLKEPLLIPNEDERHGYVPNVVYSCGSMVHHDQLFIPYAVSDYASSFATIPLAALLGEIMHHGK
jgi:predicted GH43/DUF377 family glycosyl hydrolase